MIEEELPDELENDLDDIEPVGDESQLYEHFPQPYSESCRRWVRYGQWQAGEE